MELATPFGSRAASPRQPSSRGQQLKTVEAFRAGAVSSTRADSSEHQSNVSQSKVLFGPTLSRSAMSMSVHLLKEAHAGKAEFLSAEPARLSLALCGLSEVRWTGQGQKQVGAYTVHFSGGSTKHHGVALALSQAASSACRDVHL